MTIAADIRATNGKKTGKGWMVYSLVEAMTKLQEALKHKFVLYTDKKTEFDFKLPNNFSVHCVYFPSVIWHFIVAFKLYFTKEVDVYLSPTSFIVPALTKKKKCIVVVNDLVSLLFPEGHNKRAVLLEGLFMKPAVRKARHIIAISQSTKNDVYRHLKIAWGKTYIAQIAANEIFKVVKDERLKDKIKSKYKLPDNFFLFVGTLEPRKNIERLVAALKYVQNRGCGVKKLVIVGKKGWGYGEIFQEVRRFGLEKDVIFTDYISEKDLVVIYNLATTFVFPSLYEGFGIPPLEAMKCGCPVVASKVASVPEVVGDAAILVDPKIIRDIARGMLESIERHDLLIKLGFAQSEKFSWEHTAERFLNIITE
ncbi:MAG: mannosyltransferase B-like protein [uncultured bacterium]|nr:MAG: mannosyltransferase B-like protein [uncultured bacterium]